MGRIQFFATRSDLLAFLELVEDRKAIKYTGIGRFPPQKDIDLDLTYASAKDIAGLGVSNHSSSILSNAYLVSDRNLVITPRFVSVVTMGDMLFIDQLRNPETVVLTPGGEFGENVLLMGSVSSVGSSKNVRTMMRLLRTCLEKCGFIKSHFVFLGSNAIKFLKAGNRLTISAESPVEDDFPMVEENTGDVTSK